MIQLILKVIIFTIILGTIAVLGATFNGYIIQMVSSVTSTLTNFAPLFQDIIDILPAPILIGIFGLIGITFVTVILQIKK